MLLCSILLIALSLSLWSNRAGTGSHSVQPRVDADSNLAAGKRVYEGIILRAALIGGGMYEPLYESIAKFERDTGAKVEIAFKGNNYELDKKINQDVVKHSINYDVISTHTSLFLQYADDLEPLNSWFTDDELQDFSPSILYAGKIDGDQLMIPRLADISVYFYRTDLFNDEANKSKFKAIYKYDLAPPETLDQMKDIAVFFSTIEYGLSGIQFAGKEEAITGRFMELTQAFGGDFFDENKKVILNEIGGLKAAQYLRDLYSVGAMPKDMLNYLWDEEEYNFASGKVAMYSEWPGWYSTLDDPTSSTVAGKFDVFRAPAGPSGVHPGWGGAHGFAIMKSSNHKQAAAALVKFLTSAENMTSESKLGSTPVRLSVWEKVLNDAKTGDPRKRNFYKVLNTALTEDFRTPPPIKQWIPLSDILYPYLQRIIIGDISPKQGLDAAAKEITRMMAQPE